MQERILVAIKEVDISDICHFQNLVDCKSLSEILIKADKISFAVDVGILKIDNKNAQILVGRIKDKIKTISNFVVNVILTSSRTDSIYPEKEIADEKSKSFQAKNSYNQSSNSKSSIVRGVKNIIAVASGKGGVGKSTVAVNLAISLRKIGYKVGLVDADIYGPSIAYLMNLQGKPESDGSLMIPITSYGVECISVGSLVEASKASIWRGPMVTKVLTQLISGVKWLDIDYLIIDLPPGTGDVHLSLVQQFKPDGVVLVSTPQNLAVIDVVKAVDMFKTLQIPILGVLQNMAYLLEEKNGNTSKNYIFGKDVAKKMAIDLGLDFLGDIPISSEVNQANDNHNPICNQIPNHLIAFEFGQIAEKILDKIKSYTV